MGVVHQNIIVFWTGIYVVVMSKLVLSMSSEFFHISNDGGSVSLVHFDRESSIINRFIQSKVIKPHRQIKAISLLYWILDNL